MTDVRLSTTIASINFGGSYSETKVAMLRSYVNRGSFDVVFLQEVAVERFKFYGYEEIVNLNAQRRGTAVLYKEGMAVSGVVRLPDGHGIAMCSGDTVFVNIYAPSGSQHRLERKNFFAEGITPLFGGVIKEIVFGGDFNCIVEKKTVLDRV